MVHSLTGILAAESTAPSGLWSSLYGGMEAHEERSMREGVRWIFQKLAI
jgi:hypothetical protein